MLNELINLLGKPINDPELKAFIEKKGLKYPKKDTYSQNSDASDVYVTGKKMGKTTIGNRKFDEFEFTLNFAPQRWNPKYPEIPTERGGMFYYRLNNIEINNRLMFELLDRLSIPVEATLDELFKILGKRKESKYNSYSWIVPLDKEKDICVSIYYDHDDKDIMASLAIPERPLYSDFPVQEFNEVLGRSINSPEVKAFIEKYNGTYPKKDTIDSSIDPSTVKGNIRYQTEGLYYTLTVAGGSMGLTFGLKDKTEKYFPVPAKKANCFYPILNTISLYDFYRFEYEDSIVNFPLGVNSHDSVDTIIKKWGKPHRGSEKEGFYCWEIPVNDDGDFVLEVFYGVKDTANQFYGIELNTKLKSE